MVISRRFFTLIIIVLLGFVTSYPVYAIDEKNSIIWMEAEFPPGYIHEGPNKGEGYEDVITSILQENLKEYEHSKIICNLARMYYEFKEEENVCNVALFKTPEREEFMYFSIPSTFTFPNRLVTLKSKLNLFDDSKVISLEDSLKKEVRLGISKDRSYGKNIDAIIEKYKDHGNIFVHSGKDVFESLLKMLVIDRLDCILGLPEEVIYVAEDVGIKSQIISITLKENENTYDSWLGYVACSKTEFGKQLIERINQILLEHRPTPRYRMAYERWLDQNSIKNYQNLYNDIFLKINE